MGKKTWCLDNGSLGQQLLDEWTGQCTDDARQYSMAYVYLILLTENSL